MKLTQKARFPTPALPLKPKAVMEATYKVDGWGEAVPGATLGGQVRDVRHDATVVPWTRNDARSFRSTQSFCMEPRT